MGFAGIDPRQLAPSMGTTQVGSAISAASSTSSTPANAMTPPALIDPTTQAESDLFGSLGFTAHLSTLQPVFADLRSGINLTFGAYQIYINHWGTLRLIDSTQAPASATTATIDAVTARATSLRVSRDSPPNSRLQATRDHSSGPLTWRISITRMSKKAVRTPSQVFMVEVDASAARAKTTTRTLAKTTKPAARQKIPATLVRPL